MWQAYAVMSISDMPLLWVLRDTLGLMGTKDGCGMAQCGACTVHVDAAPVRSCSLPVSAARGKEITTIEGLALNGDLHPVQRAWLDLDVPQCGYIAESGMIMAVAALLEGHAAPERRRDRRGHFQHLPLRHLSACPRGDSRRGRRVSGP